MAELADALDLGSSGATRTGSIPARCTNEKSVTFWQHRMSFSLKKINIFCLTGFATSSDNIGA